MDAGPEEHNPLPGLTVTIVCCDNESTIERCVSSVTGLAARVIAVDSGSSDRTTEILHRHGVEVVYQQWLGFVKQKQFALDMAETPWVLHLDSDESIEPELAAEIRRVVRADPDATSEPAGCWCNRKVWWAGRPLEHTWQPEWRLRLAQRARARWTGYDPHDEMVVGSAEPGGTGGKTVKLTGDMRHDAIADLPSFLARQVRHAQVAAESYESMGRRGRVSKLITSPAGTMLKMLVLKGGLRDGWRGWCAATAAATGAAMKHAILLERTRRG